MTPNEKFLINRVADKADQYVAERKYSGILESALKDIAELAVENGPEWASRRALRALAYSPINAAAHQPREERG